MQLRRTSSARRVAFALVAASVLAACSEGLSEREATISVPGAVAAPVDERVPVQPANVPGAGESSTSTEMTGQTTATTTEADTPMAASTTTALPETSTSTTSSTTTTTVPELDVYAPECVVEVQPGDSLGLITDRYDDETITVATVRAENGIEGETIYPGQILDMCVDNGLDDITGSERKRNEAVVEAETTVAIEAQQTRLNQLFTGLGIRDLLVDGISGSVTRQRLCAARISLGLPVALTDMEPGSEEEATLMAAESLPLPYTSALNSDRWILIDRTCQIMFVGKSANELTFVFPTSTGEIGYQTRDQDRSRIFRFDPALDNNGWHDSTDFPVDIDNPLNGNMHKPLYFDGGQAIHGANNVPTTPQSKGCARLRPGDQDLLIGWLGLADADRPTNSSDRINVTVNVQGAYPHTQAEIDAALAELAAEED
jgi:LysM repeat protein